MTRLCTAIVLLICVAALPIACSRQVAQRPTKENTKAVTTLLPDWASQNPSPEFLRANEIFAPIPVADILNTKKSTPEVKAAISKYTKTFPAAWEFFGSLSDEQISRFRQTNEIRVPVKSLTAPQRTALNNWFKSFKYAMHGTATSDWLVFLYKEGAKEDLTNVDVGFVSQSHDVNMQFWVTRSNGSVSTPSNSVAMVR